MTLETTRSKLVLGLALFALVAAGVVLSTDAQPANALPAPQTIETCPANMQHNGAFGSLNMGIATAGLVQIQFGQQFNTPDGRAGVTFDVIDMISTGNAQGLGPAEFTLDRTRGGSGEYTANQNSSNFPGTQRVTFHLNLETGGREYRSLNAATLISTSVGSLPPQPGTVYTLASQVKLEDITDPGKVAMVLQPGQAGTITN